MDKMSTLYTSG